MKLIRRRKNEPMAGGEATFADIVDSLFGRNWLPTEAPRAFEWQGFPLMDVCEDEHNFIDMSRSTFLFGKEHTFIDRR